MVTGAINSEDGGGAQAPAPQRQRSRRAIWVLAVVVGAVTLAVLGAGAVVWLSQPSQVEVQAAPDPLKPTGRGVYLATPSCEAFSDKVAAELDQNAVNFRTYDDSVPELAADGSTCRWYDAVQSKFDVRVEVSRYDEGMSVGGPALAQGQLKASVNLSEAERVSGDWDFAVLHDCGFHARDSNLLVVVSLWAYDASCDRKPLLRYAKDWTAQNFTM